MLSVYDKRWRDTNRRFPGGRSHSLYQESWMFTTGLLEKMISVYDKMQRDTTGRFRGRWKHGWDQES